MSIITKEMQVEIPAIPNFIQVGDQWMPISNFTDTELTEIGKEWLIKLIKKANTNRKNGL